MAGDAHDSTYVGSAAEGDTTGSVAAPATTAEVVELLPLQTADMRIVDTAGRDVLLRGANVNSLGEYWQGVPSIPATMFRTRISSV